jgi:uncharacterized protein YyaL (SSP411 family)
MFVTVTGMRVRRVILASIAGVACVAASGSAQTPVFEETPVAQTTDTPKHTNRLAGETSPYLLQHAHNPVDWYPWGAEAIQKAKSEDKPIFLSIGYAACHWCHVMERESFESEEIAAVLNEHYVSIKVDREERPDVDEIYMTAVQAMTGSGGWPMSMFLTPDLKPFYGGTYYPPDDRYGRPGFKTVLLRLAEAWETRRSEVLDSAAKLTGHIEGLLTGSIGGESEITPAIVSNTAAALVKTFDSVDGGFGGAPKFPSAPSIQVLLREYARTRDAKLLEAAKVTLDKMAQGGMYDHIGGGFARYSVDAQWLVPHFEKMLYDNAQLVVAYTEAYQVTRDPFYADVVHETLNYLLRDMRDAGGGFHSSEDADSEGQEGKFYIWTLDEIEEMLGEADAKIAAAYYNLQAHGNFTSHEPYHAGMNVLHTPESDDVVARNLAMSVEELREKIARIDKSLFDAREKRVRPPLDDKVLVSWNALTITALAKAHQTFGDEKYRVAAIEAAEFVLREMSVDDGLLHTHRAGTSRIAGFLDDYAFFVDALIDLYESTFDPRWLDEAERLADKMVETFWDSESAGFYVSEEDHDGLILRVRASQDSSVPSGASVAAQALLRLAKFLDRADYHDKARALLESNYRFLAEAPRAFIKMIVAADFMVHAPREIAIAGPMSAASTQALLATVRTKFVPNKIVAWTDPASPSAAARAENVPLLAAKDLVAGKPAAYVCKDYACQRPVTSPEELAAQLGV